jgi:DNA polymerase IV
MTGSRKILHIDLDAFFCAVEEKLDPILNGLAFAVGGSPEGRGVVTSCSYAARKFGIKSAMPMISALRQYPALKVVRSHFKEYLNSSKAVMAILQDYTPLFEQISIDEAFLDVSDLSQPGIQTASEIQKKILLQLSLPCSIGVATNKLVAKIATNIGKSRNKGKSAPMAILEVQPGQEKAFLAPLPIDEMWGIGPKTAIQMRRMGIVTIGDVQKKSEKELATMLGKYGRILFRHASGFDDRPVADYDGIKSVSNEITFFKDRDDEAGLLESLTDLSIKVGYRLRKRGLSGHSIKLKIRWPDFQTQTRQLTLTHPTNQDSVIISSIRQLFYQTWKKGLKVRLIGVGIGQLCDDFQQLSLFDLKSQKEKQLLEAMDMLHQKYGEKALQRGLRKNSYRDWKE